MKKIIAFVCLIMLLTGCSKIDNNTTDYMSLVEKFLSTKKITNNVSTGYKFYVPKGSILLENYDFNQKIMIDNNNIYLYVDLISYYYKNNVNYNDKEKDVYYFSNFSFDDNVGYIKIIKEDDSYYTKIVYNYAKIEFYSSEKELPKLISISTIILNNIEYNDTIVKKIMENNSGNYSNTKYSLEKPDDAKSNFSQYLEEYIQEPDEEKKQVLPDE